MTLLVSAPSTVETATSPAPVRESVREPVRTLPLAAWAGGVVRPVAESRRARAVARLGGVLAILSLVAYLGWRVLATIPPVGPWRWAAWLLVGFEALPLVGSVTKLFSLWTIDTHPAPPVAEAPGGMRVAVLIPTYNEPAEVVGPTIVAAKALEPAHQTWVLDDGDRPWLRELCRDVGVRYVTRERHDHAKAGNLNHALAVMAREEAAGAEPIDLIAVLDCDHVPLEGFLTSTLGYFADEDVALVQAPQTFYNAGAFDDDGYTGEQGLFFNVQLAARHHAGAGTFWCGSTSVLRVAALRAVGGVASDTVTEDLHTTLKLQRQGWRTVYHHQNLALGLAPATPDQYLLQRRRWGMGAMQVVVQEKLWRRQRWMSWRTQFEYVVGALWWLEGVATVAAMSIPATLMVSGAATSTAPAWQFLSFFLAAFAVRMWGYKALLRRQIRWRTAFALRVLRVPVGLSCVWWLVSRRNLQFKVTPKGADVERHRGRVPRVVLVLGGICLALAGYASLGLAGLVPWRTDGSSTMFSGLWVLISAAVLAHAILRIRSEQYATSRRAAHRFPVETEVRLDDRVAHLMDVSVNGAAVRVPEDEPVRSGLVTLQLPGTEPVLMRVASQGPANGERVVKLSIPSGNWHTLKVLALWLFHTPADAVDGLPHGVPVAAVRAA